VTELAAASPPGDCVFGTKMRSVIRSPNANGVKRVVAQQFAVAAQVLAAGLVPIIEPEVAIDAPEKRACEKMLFDELSFYLNMLSDTTPEARVCLKLTLPEDPSLYDPFVRGNHPSVMRVFALSGGYSRKEACERLARCESMTASFSRALTEGLRVDQGPASFASALEQSVKRIYEASTT
jgi:fructose-bisphosphate aldolase class I